MEDEARAAQQAVALAALEATRADERLQVAQAQAMARLSDAGAGAPAPTTTATDLTRSASFVTRLSPEELRALAEQLVKEGKLTRDDVDASRKK